MALMIFWGSSMLHIRAQNRKTLASGGPTFGLRAPPENCSSRWAKIGEHVTKTAGAYSELDKT